MSAAPSELGSYAAFIQRVVEGAVAALSELSDEQINWSSGAVHANSMYAVATHLVAMGECWVLGLVDGGVVVRDRQAEFRAAGAATDVVVRLQDWGRACGVLLQSLESSALAEDALVPAEYFEAGGFAAGRFSRRECLMHVLEHSALHLGHLQMMQSEVDH